MNRPSESGYALVIGGTGAVGAAVARELARSSTPIAFTYHSNSAKAEEVSEELAEIGVSSLHRAVDGLDYDAMAGFVADASAELGSVATLVYASSPHAKQMYLGQVEPARFREHLQQDVSVFFNAVRASLPMLRESRGSVVAVTTVATRRFPVRDGLSAGPKGAVESLVRAFAAEEGRYGVRFNSVGPGILSDGVGARLIESGEFDTASQQAALERTPLRRFGTAEEIARAVRFLASDAASFITGQKLDVDGGYSI